MGQEISIHSPFARYVLKLSQSSSIALGARNALTGTNLILLVPSASFSSITLSECFHLPPGWGRYVFLYISLCSCWMTCGLTGILTTEAWISASITVTGYFRFTPVPGGSFLTHYFFKLLIENLDSFDPVRRLDTLYFSYFLQSTKDFRGLLVKQVLLVLVLIYFSYGSDDV